MAADQPALPPRLKAALDSLEREILRGLVDRLREDTDGRVEEEFRRRSEDYRCWQRMGEVPARVSEIAETISGGIVLTDEAEAELHSSILGILERCYRSAPGGGCAQRGQ